MNNIKSFVVLALRNLRKNKITSVINVTGLTIGLASAVLAILFARHELTYESCHKNADRLYSVYTAGNFGQFNQVPTTFGPEGKDLKNLFPEIEKYSVTRSLYGTVRVGDAIFNESKILYADSAFFQLFTLVFKKGQPSQDPSTIVISEKTASRYFGKDNPIGQYISVNSYGEKVDFTVTGTYQDLPSNTHIEADFIIPFTFTKRIPYWNADIYDGTNFNTYLLLADKTDYKALNSKIVSQFKIPVNLENVHAFIQPIKEIHFSGIFDNNKGKLMGFLIGGLFVLITSIFNYINMTNIIYSTRKKEIGVRKVNGGIWKNIFSQFLSDTAVITLICFIAAILLILLILPRFNSLMDTHIVLSLNWQVILICLLLYTFTVLFSGIYPALRFSFIKPVNLLSKEVNRLDSHSWSRYLLTSFQFILAIVFIQFILIIQKQNNHLDSRNIKGYNNDNVICLSAFPWGNLNNVKEELLKNPGVEYVSWGSQVPSMGLNVTMDWKEADNKIPASIYYYEDDFLTLFDIKMAQGRFFSDEFMSEKSNGVVINKETARILEYMDPLGKQVMIRGKMYTITGIVDDYMAHPPIFDKSPLLILPGQNSSDFLFIRIKKDNRDASHQFITETLRSFNPDYPVELVYHRDFIFTPKESKSFITTFALMNLFFYLTICMSLIGLFGMSIFIANRSIKEIGIRKVFGASALEMILRLLKGLFIQVLIAILISTPLIVVITKGYLSTFPYGIRPGFLFYFTGGGVAILLMAITVGWQTWQASRSNPVEALRYE